MEKKEHTLSLTPALGTLAPFFFPTFCFTSRYPSELIKRYVETSSCQYLGLKAAWRCDFPCQQSLTNWLANWSAALEQMLPYWHLVDKVEDASDQSPCDNVMVEIGVNEVQQSHVLASWGGPVFPLYLGDGAVDRVGPFVFHGW